MYKIVKSFNIFSETACTVFTRFHTVHKGSSVVRILTFLNGSTPFKKIAAMPL